MQTTTVRPERAKGEAGMAEGSAPVEPTHPRTRQDVLYWLEGGRIGGETAVRHLRQLGANQAEEDRERSAATGAALRRDGVFQELDALIGLTTVKMVIREIEALVEIQRRRQQVGLKVETQMLHMVFKGPPGTGKTTVARLLGGIFRSLEVLTKGHLIEVERADLVGEYIGHTAQRTRDAIRKALGGILFVDEAYALARGGPKDFGKEAIDTLVKAMEDYKGQFVLILAGYPKEMDLFVETNPGLRSRFGMILDFPPYTAQELVTICRHMLRERQYVLAPGAEGELEHYFNRIADSAHPYAGNARMVRNLMERAIRRQALRLVKRRVATSRETLMELSWVDFDPGAK